MIALSGNGVERAIIELDVGVAATVLVPGQRAEPGDFLGQQRPQDLGGVPPLGLGRGEDLGCEAAHVEDSELNHARSELAKAAANAQQTEYSFGPRVLAPPHSEPDRPASGRVIEDKDETSALCRKLVGLDYHRLR